MTEAAQPGGILQVVPGYAAQRRMLSDEAGNYDAKRLSTYDRSCSAASARTAAFDPSNPHDSIAARMTCVVIAHSAITRITMSTESAAATVEVPAARSSAAATDSPSNAPRNGHVCLRTTGHVRTRTTWVPDPESSTAICS